MYVGSLARAHPTVLDTNFRSTPTPKKDKQRGLAGCVADRGRGAFHLDNTSRCDPQEASSATASSGLARWIPALTRSAALYYVCMYSSTYVSWPWRSPLRDDGGLGADTVSALALAFLARTVQVLALAVSAGAPRASAAMTCTLSPIPRSRQIPQAPASCAVRRRLLAAAC